MHSGHRVNALIMELVIALLFFSIASVTIMGVFSATRATSLESTATGKALYIAEDTAERMSACKDIRAFIAAEGLEEGIDLDGAVMTARLENEENGAGTAVITVTYNEKTVITLPVTGACGAEG